MNEQGESWDNYRAMVLSELRDLKSDVKEVKDNHLFHMNASIEKLEAKMVLFGAGITVLVPTLTAVIIKFIK